MSITTLVVSFLGYWWSAVTRRAAGYASGMRENVRLESSVLQIGRSLVRSKLMSLEFFIDIKSFRSHYGPGVDSASNRNEYQEYFLGVKAAGA